jgi:hypothetical protein
MRRNVVVPALFLVLAAAVVLGLAGPPPAVALGARDKQMKAGIALLQGYIETYAGRHGFAYPASSLVAKGRGLPAAVWPANPWTGKAMAPGTARGTYVYTVAADGRSYRLLGHLASGARYPVSGAAPAWVDADQTASADRQAELGARVIKGYIDQWGMLNNGTAPTAQQVSATGDVGALFSSWPANPYTSALMSIGSGAGDIGYTPGSNGAYTLTAHLSTGALDLSGTVPQQLRTALDAARNELVKVDMLYLQASIDRSAFYNADALPATVSKLSLGDYVPDYWPGNPWFAATDMVSGSNPGTYSYVLANGGYTLTGHLTGGASWAVDGSWATRQAKAGSTRNDRLAEAGLQVVKEYIDEWIVGHGALPSAAQIDKAAAVGAPHAFWPTNPWSVSPMAGGDNLGDFQYSQGSGTTYTLTVRQAPVAPYAEYYTAQ